MLVDNDKRRKLIKGCKCMSERKKKDKNKMSVASSVKEKERKVR